MHHKVYTDFNMSMCINELYFIAGKLLYVLLMWLSLLILAPFELCDFGTQIFIDCSNLVTKRTIPDRVLAVSQECLR